MTSDAVVDVCVLTWNTRELTLSALALLRESTQDVPVRILLRDNASSDGTAPAVAQRFPDVEVDAGEVNVGFAHGMNLLMQRATAPYVLLLNGDAWPEPAAVRRMVEAAQARPDAAAVAPRLVRPDGTVEHSTWPFPSLGLSLLYATGVRGLLPLRLANKWLLEDAWLHDEPRWVPWAVGAALLIPRGALDRVGNLGEQFFMYGEDVEWCWRARDAGLRIWFEPTAVVRHVGSASADRNFGAEVTARKVVASLAVMRLRRGRLIATLWQLLEMATAARIGLLAALRRDPAARTWARAVIRAHWQARR
jgi:N-acetylglucosaminyl-diphospho-decaprenol L-rhamnosyltransferase